MYDVLFQNKGVALFQTAELLLTTFINSLTQWVSCTDLVSHQVKRLIHSGDNNNPRSTNTQTIPPITLTYLRDDNIFLPLCFTLHKVKLTARRHDVIEPGSAGCSARPHRAARLEDTGAAANGSAGWSHRGGRMSNGLSSKGHSDDIVGITEVIVKRLHCGRFTVAP